MARLTEHDVATSRVYNITWKYKKSFVPLTEHDVAISSEYTITWKKYKKSMALLTDHDMSTGCISMNIT